MTQLSYDVKTSYMHAPLGAPEPRRYQIGEQSGVQKIVISVSKSYIHRGKRFRHRQATKKKWHVYYYEMDHKDGKYRLKTKRVNWLQAMYFKTQRKHRFKYYCTECGSAAVAFLKSKRSTLECPNCGR